jgi:hypothetical protein
MAPAHQTQAAPFQANKVVLVVLDQLPALVADVVVMMK